jgi:hypothetical protein
MHIRHRGNPAIQFGRKDQEDVGSEDMIIEKKAAAFRRWPAEWKWRKSYRLRAKERIF